MRFRNEEVERRITDAMARTGAATVAEIASAAFGDVVSANRPATWAPTTAVVLSRLRRRGVVKSIETKERKVTWCLLQH